MLEGAGEDGAGDEGREGGGGGQGQGEARGEGGDVIAQGEGPVKSRLLCGMESGDSHLALDSTSSCDDDDDDETVRASVTLSVSSVRNH